MRTETLREDLREEQTAISLGFEVIEEGPGVARAFAKGVTRIWYVGPTRASVTLPPEAMKGSWMCADLVDGYYCNHRSYYTLIEALSAEQ